VALKRLEPQDPRSDFSCGDGDLDEFYRVDSIAHGTELMAVSYEFLNDDGAVVAFFSVSNDAIKGEEAPRSAWEKLLSKAAIPRPKRYSSMPACKIGRIGVCHTRHGQKIGTQVLDYLKAWFTTNNKTGCRFLIVDAYNKPRVLKFYTDNGFSFLTGKDEKEETRIMYFDLKTFRP
jgi:GNAT superfamily N-acetyltransferase